MRIFLRIAGIVIAVLSLLLFLAVPVTGAIFLIIGALFIFLSIKLPRKTKMQESQSTAAEAGDTVFIEYEDADGNFSDRTIEIKKVYEKGGKLYVLAYCFMKGEDRTFLVERMFGMRKKRGGEKIKDIKGFFLEKKDKPLSATAEDLAAQAIE
jgi:flagellar biosynthesis component FlhA